MARILIVDDDIELCHHLSSFLRDSSHAVDSVNDAESAMARIENSDYDVIILDITLPGISGLDLLRQLRAVDWATCVLMLTGRVDAAEITRGLAMGADDYVTKPVDATVLRARIEAVLRRQHKKYSDTLRLGNLEIRVKQGAVLKNGAEIRLQPKEIAILQLLATYPEETFSAEELIKRIWGTEVNISVDSVRVCMTRLRKKIDDDANGSIIRTVSGTGYCVNRFYSPPK